MQVRTKTGRLGIGILIMCQSGVICLPTHLFSLLDTNNFISEGGRGAWDFFYAASLCSYLHALIVEKQQIPIL
jgi:hypothetical protein